MADDPPLYFRKRLGGLYPSSAAASDALAQIGDGNIRVRMTNPRGNVRRNGLYWAVLGIATPLLSERVEGAPLTVKLLHRVLKDRAGLFAVVKLPSGEAIKDYDSIAFDKMPETDRAEFVTFALGTLSKWLGVEVSELTREGEQQFAA